MNLDNNNWLNQSITNIKGTPAQPQPAAAATGTDTEKPEAAKGCPPNPDQLKIKGGRLVGQAQAFMPIGPNVSDLTKEILNAKGSERDDLILNFKNHLENMFPEQLENEANAALEYLANRAAQPGNDAEEPTIALLAKTIGKVLHEKQHRGQPAPFPPSPLPPRPFPPMDPGPLSPGPNIRFD